jgi:hypothetical protein
MPQSEHLDGELAARFEEGEAGEEQGAEEVEHRRGRSLGPSRTLNDLRADWVSETQTVPKKRLPVRWSAQTRTENPEGRLCSEARHQGGTYTDGEVDTVLAHVRAGDDGSGYVNL